MSRLLNLQSGFCVVIVSNHWEAALTPFQHSLNKFDGMSSLHAESIRCRRLRNGGLSRVPCVGPLPYQKIGKSFVHVILPIISFASVNTRLMPR